MYKVISQQIFFTLPVFIGGTLRVATAGGKAGQGNQLIQLAGSGAGGVPQFAVVSQGNIISLAGSLNTQRVVSQVCWKVVKSFTPRNSFEQIGTHGNPFSLNLCPHTFHPNGSGLSMCL